jgi:hypothetical protein
MEYMNGGTIEPTNTQLLEAIQGVDHRLEGLTSDFKNHVSDFRGHVSDFKSHVSVVEDRFVEVNETIYDLAQHMDERFDGLERRVTKVEATMVTKSYLDDKLADRRGDLVGMLRTEDQKVNRLVGVLSEKKTLSPSETKDVLSFPLFP